MKTRLAFAALALSGLAGCAVAPNEGTFTVEGQVVAVGEQSITILPKKVISEDGLAKDWFEETERSEIHDNFVDARCDTETVGEVFDAQGTPELLNSVRPGEMIHIEGYVKSSYTDCYYNTSSHSLRPVYTAVHEMLG